MWPLRQNAPRAADSGSRAAAGPSHIRDVLARIRSAAVLGVDAYPVDVEIDISSGLPSFATVGLPQGAVREGRERVTAAIANAGFCMPLRRVTVNLAPADVPKAGSAFDLPIALGILVASEQLPGARLEGLTVVGEVGLTGELRPVRGALSIAVGVRDRGGRALLVPAANVREAAVVAGLEVYGAASLGEVVDHLTGLRPLAPVREEAAPWLAERHEDQADFADVRGQEAAKRALEVAAAGAHNLLFIGPPGAGKTMLARRLPGILPALTLAEALETTKVHSVAGLVPAGRSLVTARPFRAPHHTISDAGLVGGGSPPRPGEVSLAHGGVLFLDELPHFRVHVLEVLRQPLEDGHVVLSRAALSVTYPARVMLAAAMNPCPCGHAGDPTRACRCLPDVVRRYRTRLSGPLLDRIDIHLEVPALPYRDLAGTAHAEPSAVIRERVEAARARQRERFRAVPGVHANAHMSVRELRRFCAASPGVEALLRAAIARFGLSARAYHRVLRIARTIADLAGEEELLELHAAEAIRYRTLDRGEPRVARA
jgi:magnesium chelatase family protein